MTSYTFSIDFPRWKVLPYDSFRSEVVLLAKRNMLRYLRDHSERFKWSREQAQNLSLHIFFSHNYHNYSMFRDVPECSGMFRNVPGCSMFHVLSTAMKFSVGVVSGVVALFRVLHVVSRLSRCHSSPFTAFTKFVTIGRCFFHWGREFLIYFGSKRMHNGFAF